MAPQEEVTYETLVNRWKKEVRSSQLAKLDPSFYTAVDEHIRNLQGDYDREYQVNPQSAKAMILQDELRNLTKVRDDLYEVREKKILMAALAAARGSNVDKSLLTRGETDLFEDLERILRDGRKAILRRGEREAQETPASAAAAAAIAAAPVPVAQAPVGPAPVAAPPPPQSPAPESVVTAPPVVPVPPAAVPQPPPAEAPAEAAAPPAAAPAAQRRAGHLLVRMLTDVAPFVGNDMRHYRLSREDVASVPKEIAHALVTRGKAALVSAPA